MTTLTCDDYSQNIYTVPVGQCNQQTSVEESKYEDKPKSVLTVPVGSISKKEPRNLSENKTMRLYIFPGAPTFFYQQGNHNSCILSSLASSFHYMADEYMSEYIIRRKQKYLLGIEKSFCMYFCVNIFIGHHK